MAEKTLKPAIRFKGFTNAWEQCELGSCVDVTTGKLDANAMVIDGEFDFYTSGIAKYRIDNFAFEGPAITIAGNGATVGYMHLADGKFNAYQRTYVLTNFKSDRLFTFRAISQKLPKKISNEARTGNIPYIVMEMLTKLDIMIPNIEEQTEIGSIFNSVDNLITLHQRKYDKLVNIKKSLLHTMFPSDGENVPKVRFKGFTNAWEQRKVREVADRYDNLRIPVAANLRIPGSTPYYGANGIQDYVDGFTHDGEFVLVAEDGANDLKNYPVKCVKGRIWVNNHAHVLQGKQESTDNCFLAYAISQADIESILVGGSRAKLNAETLMEVLLLLPSKTEQSQIGEYFERLDDLITLHQRKLEKLNNIKKSLLNRMFI